MSEILPPDGGPSPNVSSEHAFAAISADGRSEPVPAATAAIASCAELAKIVLGNQPLNTILTRIAQVAQQAIPGVDDVSVTLMDLDRPRTVAFSGQLGPALDERQYRAGFGPCMDAAVTGDLVEVTDTAIDTLYPEFSRQAARAGIRRVLALGLVAPAPGGSGALNLYSAGEPFDQDVRKAAVAFTSYAAVAVMNAAVVSGAINEAEQLRQAMDSRAAIEQAKGIIMATRRCSPDEAFDVLRQTSSRANQKLRLIAQDIVTKVLSSDIG